MEDFKKRYREGAPDIISFAREIIKELPDGKGNKNNYRGGWSEYAKVVLPLLFEELKKNKVELMPSMYEVLDEALRKDYFENK